MEPTWVLSAPDGPHIGPMNLVIRGHIDQQLFRKQSLRCTMCDTVKKNSGMISQKVSYVCLITALFTLKTSWAVDIIPQHKLNSKDVVCWIVLKEDKDIGVILNMEQAFKCPDQRWPSSLLHVSFTRKELMFLTHWGWNKMTAVLQMTFSNSFSWMKMVVFSFKLHGSLLCRIHLTVSTGSD